MQHASVSIPVTPEKKAGEDEPASRFTDFEVPTAVDKKKLYKSIPYFGLKETFEDKTEKIEFNDMPALDPYVGGKSRNYSRTPKTTEIERHPACPVTIGISSYNDRLLSEYAEKFSGRNWMDVYCSTEGYLTIKKLRGQGLLQKAKAISMATIWTAEPVLSG